MITLLTGQPGHGKTAYGLVKAMEWKKEGRLVYANGIRDLDYDAIGFKPLDDPKKWMDLPDGTAIILDEVYNDFPNRNASAKVPEHVNLLATHRHRGFDFIFICQQTVQLDPFIKGLVEEHVHVKKKFGKFTELRRWSSFQSNVKAICADKMDWVRPNHIFQYYTSTTVNTSKLHIPKWLKLAVAALVVVVGVVTYLGNRVTDRVEEARGTQPTLQGALGAQRLSGAPSAPVSRTYENLEEYVRAHTARDPMLPWSAPVYDQRQVTAEPIVACMSAAAGEAASGEVKPATCTCHTEQGTPYTMDIKQCELLARRGPVYNPYKAKPLQAPMGTVEPVQLATASKQPVAMGEPGKVARYGQFRSDELGPDGYTAESW